MEAAGQWQVYKCICFLQIAKYICLKLQNVFVSIAMQCALNGGCRAVATGKSTEREGAADSVPLTPTEPAP